MREIGIEELKVIQMDIMSAVHRFCEEHNLRYSLACGSMLGAARHKGYIPWDDDIDIYLLRDDYNKMNRLFPKLLDGRYEFHTLERDSKWRIPYGKVLDKKTILQEGKVVYSVNIDVYPIDRVPGGEEWPRYDRFRRKCFYFYLRRPFPLTFQAQNGVLGFFRSAVSFLFNLSLRCFTAHFFALCYQKVITYYNKKETGMVFECAQGIFQKCPFPETLFDNRRLMPFEDREYMCFSDYDAYLTNGFGDWRKLPPREKRVSHHDFKAWWKDDDVKRGKV